MQSIKCIWAMIIARQSQKSQAGTFIRLGQVDGKKRLALIIAVIVVAATTVTIVWVVDRSERGVVLTVDTDKEEYAPGEPVRIYIQLKNYGFRTVNLVYGTSLIMHFNIYDSNDLRVFVGPSIALMVITHVALEPGGTRSLGYVWNQVNETGEQVELPDSFTVRALSWSYEHHFYANTTFSISD